MYHVRYAMYTCCPYGFSFYKTCTTITTAATTAAININLKYQKQRIIHREQFYFLYFWVDKEFNLDGRWSLSHLIIFHVYIKVFPYRIFKFMCIYTVHKILRIKDTLVWESTFLWRSRKKGLFCILLCVKKKQPKFILVIFLRTKKKQEKNSHFHRVLSSQVLFENVKRSRKNLLLTPWNLFYYYILRTQKKKKILV